MKHQRHSPIFLTIKAVSQMLLPSCILHQLDFNSLHVQPLKLSAHHKPSCSGFYEAPVKTQPMCARKLGQALLFLLHGLEEAGGEREFLLVKIYAGGILFSTYILRDKV